MVPSLSFRFVALLVVTSVVFSGGSALAEDQKKLSKKRKIFPMLVTTVEVKEGDIQPMDEFVGATSFPRVSQVATDIGGLVRKVAFEVGETVNEGDPLAVIDLELLDINIIGTRASFEQNLIDLKSAERDLKRIDTLYNDKAVSEIDHDEYITRKSRLENSRLYLSQS